jgi:hypothetical protein
LAPNTAQNHQDPLTQHQGEKFWTYDHAIYLRLGCFDLISCLKTGVEAILTKLCVTKSNWIYAVSSYSPQGAGKQKSVTPVVGGWVRGKKMTRIRFLFPLEKKLAKEIKKILKGFFIEFFLTIFRHDFLGYFVCGVFELPSLRNMKHPNT